MTQQTLSLDLPLNDAAAQYGIEKLRAIDGISRVALAAEGSAFVVDFDEDLTSAAEMRTVLKQAGIAVKAPKHGEEGMCCGSCGS